MPDDKPNKTSPSQIRAVMKYKAKNYKRLVMDLRPEVLNEIKETAAAEGQSVTSYLVGLHKKHISDKENTDV